MNAHLVFAASNAHRISELEAILAPAWEGLEAGCMARMSDFDVASPVEGGVTFEENSLIKARALARATGLAAIVDDSGTTVDVLDGVPGIFSARWAGSRGDDAANLRLLIDQFCDVPDAHRGAAFVSAAVLVTPDGREFVKHDEVRGALMRFPYGEGGFGYDPVFVPEDFEVTTVQMSVGQRNAISHRGIAFRALTPHIVEYLRS